MKITTVKVQHGGRCEFRECHHAKATKRLSFNDDRVDVAVIEGVEWMSTEPLILCDDCAEEILDHMREGHSVIVFDLT